MMHFYEIDIWIAIIFSCKRAKYWLNFIFFITRFFYTMVFFYSLSLVWCKVSVEYIYIYAPAYFTQNMLCLWICSKTLSLKLISCFPIQFWKLSNRLAFASKWLTMNTKRTFKYNRVFSLPLSFSLSLSLFLASECWCWMMYNFFLNTRLVFKWIHFNWH